MLSGQSQYSNSIRFAGASFGAGADAIVQQQNEENVLVLANTDVGLNFFCVDVPTGNTVSSHQDNTVIPIPATCQALWI